MTQNEYIEYCKNLISEKKPIDFSEEDFLLITPEIAISLAEKFEHVAMIKLPGREIKFFEWLKEEDINVWNDLWDAADEEPYLVAMGFLPILIDKSIGFPICDLLSTDNYFFTKAHLVDQESQIFLEAAQELFREKKKLTIEQLLVLTISVRPVDIWHFAYSYKISLNRAKEAVKNLVEDNVLVHLTDAGHLATFVDF